MAVISVFYPPHVTGAACLWSCNATRPLCVHTNALQLLLQQRAETLGGSRSVASLYLPNRESGKAAETGTSAEPQAWRQAKSRLVGSQAASQPLYSDLDADHPAQQCPIDVRMASL